MSDPPPEASIVANAVLAHAYKHRNVGITFGGRGIASVTRLEGGIATDVDMTTSPPKELEIFGDATWGMFNVYGLIMTYYGGTVYHQTKRIATVVDSENSLMTESVPTAKACNITLYAREILRGLGVPCRGPTFLGSDNLANVLVARDAGSAKNSRHALRRYCIMREHMRDGAIEIGHVHDAKKAPPGCGNPADFLTKWLGGAEYGKAIAYAMNVNQRSLP